MPCFRFSTRCCAVIAPPRWKGWGSIRRWDICTHCDRGDRRWRWIVIATWLGFCAFYLVQKWGPIHGLGLGDTDDNMRLAQVRAWLGGQGWFDLRQYKLDPPAGANIHWSRIVDLPIAGLILAARPFVGNAAAERFAVLLAGAVTARGAADGG